MLKYHLQQFGKMGLSEYSAKLWEHNFDNNQNPEFPSLKPSLIQTLNECGYGSISKIAADQILNDGVLQTTHHLTPSQGPVFNSVDLISTIGLKHDIYPVAMSTGVAFSNSARSGALCFSDSLLEDILKPDTDVFNSVRKSQLSRENDGEAEKRITLIPSKFRDALVYNDLRNSKFQQSSLQAECCEDYLKSTILILNSLNYKFADVAGVSNFSQKINSYRNIAIKLSNKLQETIFPKKKFITFDVNRWIALYLSDLMQNYPDNALCQILLNPESGIDEEKFPLFLHERLSKNKIKVISLIGEERANILKKIKFENETETSIMPCPSAYLVFLILSGIHGLKCLGSFLQIEYMPEYFESWKNLPLPIISNSEYVKTLNSPTLTTGRMMLNGKPFYSIDMAMKGKTVEFSDFENIEVGEFLKSHPKVAEVA